MKQGTITSVNQEKGFFNVDKVYHCFNDKVNFPPEVGMIVEYNPFVDDRGRNKASKVGLIKRPPNPLDQYFLSLEHGYFDNDGFLKEDFIKKYPELLANRFQGNPNLNKSTQIRKYFDQVVIIEGRYKVNKQFQYVRVELSKMLPLLHSAKTKRLISEEFYSFLEKNIELAKESEKNFAEGFVQHFQFVIAYY